MTTESPCEQVKASLNALLDDQLSPHQAVSIVDHCQACVDCGEEWRQMQGVRNSCRDQLSKIEVPANLNDRIRSALELEQKKVSPLRQPKLLIAIAAAAILCIVFGNVLFNAAPSQADLPGAPTLVQYYDQPNSVADLGVSDRLEFDIKRLPMRGWTLVSSKSLSAKHVTPAVSSVGQFIFKQDGKEICCYQAMAGQFSRRTLSRSKRSGVDVWTGIVDGKSVLCWSQDARDYMILGSIAPNALFDIFDDAQRS